MYYYSLNEYLKNTFGEKVYKISLDGGMTCPNRDGKIDTRGCIFCSRGGSGEFSADRNHSITEQIREAKERIGRKTDFIDGASRRGAGAGGNAGSMALSAV